MTAALLYFPVDGKGGGLHVFFYPWVPVLHCVHILRTWISVQPQWCSSFEPFRALFKSYCSEVMVFFSERADFVQQARSFLHHPNYISWVFPHLLLSPIISFCVAFGETGILPKFCNPLFLYFKYKVLLLTPAGAPHCAHCVCFTKMEQCASRTL